MLCPKCQREGIVKRVKKGAVWVCRNKNCENYGKPYKVIKKNTQE